MGGFQEVAPDRLHLQPSGPGLVLPRPWFVTGKLARVDGDLGYAAARYDDRKLPGKTGVRVRENKCVSARLRLTGNLK